MSVGDPDFAGPLPHERLEILDEEACYRLLGSGALGRVALCVNALPLILPVHFALLDRDPVFRTERGTKLMAASAGSILCLEIDACDPVTHTGWSVLVTGPASVITDPDELAQAERLPLHPWVGHGDAFVRIEAVFVSGRRVPPPHAVA